MAEATTVGTATVMETITAREEGTETTSGFSATKAPKSNPPSDFPALTPLK